MIENELMKDAENDKSQPVMLEDISRVRTS